MALTRKLLATMSIEEDKVDQIIEAHSDTVNALKEQIATYKTDAEKLPAVQKELDELRAAAEKSDKDAYKVKYEALKEDFDKYKEEVQEKETHAKKENAYRELLKEVGVSEKRINAVMRVSDVDDIKLDDDGNVKDADKLKDGIRTEWEDFIVTTQSTGAQTATPPTGNGRLYKSKDEIMSIKDTTERQKAIAENHELFGF